MSFFQELKDDYGLNLYVVHSDGGEYLLQASNIKEADTRAKNLGLLMDESIKDVSLAKRSEYKAIYEDIKYG